MASSIGVDILKRGGTAGDAAIAVAAALCVTEPCSTGLGGDMFCLYYDASTQQVSCINGSGCSPANLTLDRVRQDCPGTSEGTPDSSDGDVGVNLNAFMFSAHSVTVPGAARGYEDVLERYGSGKFTLSELLEPAAVLAEDGFPVAPITSHFWRAGIARIQSWPGQETDTPLTVDGTVGPNAGDIIYNKDLARVLREFGSKGATDGFYKGTTGAAIVAAVQRHGGVMTMDDLESHQSTFPKPISASYRGVDLWQVPPNGQGIAGLIALKGLSWLEEKNICKPMSPDSIGTADSYHTMIEMMRLGFADARAHVTDLDHMKVTTDWLLDAERIGKRAADLFDPNKAVVQDAALPSSSTVSFQVVDSKGNAISFVNSNFMGFGTGIVPEKCGFTLQNRGAGFSTDSNHPNALAPSKRPYHTIIPGMLTHSDSKDLYATLSNMGGNMQPQGHLQLTVDMIAGELDPQAAIDLPRFCIADGSKNGVVSFESGIGEKEVESLRARGHNMLIGLRGYNRSVFGRAQIIKRDRSNGVLWAGSDGRADGCAIGF